MRAPMAAHRATDFFPPSLTSSLPNRCKKVYDGVTHAAKLYPNAYIIMILIGTLKGWWLVGASVAQTCAACFDFGVLFHPWTDCEPIPYFPVLLNLVAV